MNNLLMALGAVRLVFVDDKAADVAPNDLSLHDFELILSSLREVVNSIGGLSMLDTPGYQAPLEEFDVAMVLEEVASLVRPRLPQGVITSCITAVNCNASGTGGVVSGSRQHLKQVGKPTSSV